MSNLSKRETSMLSTLVGTMATVHGKLESSEELELEIKIPDMNQADFNTLYKAVTALKHVGKVQQSIFAIASVSDQPRHTASWESRSVKRMEMFFKNGVRDKSADQYIQKTNISRFQKGRPVEYVVKLAKEKVISAGDFPTTGITDYRFRLRSSIMIDDKNYPEFGSWRFDFTFTRVISKRDDADIVQKLPEFRDQFFRKTNGPSDPTGPNGPTVENFLDWEPPSNMNIAYEVELEWVPGADTLDTVMKKIADSTEARSEFVASIEQLMPVTLGLVDPAYYERLGYHQIMFEVASALVPSREAVDYKSHRTLKNLVNRPKSFTKHDWHAEILPKIDDFYISDKADGERAFLVMGSEFVEPSDCLLLTADRIVRLTDIKVPADFQRVEGGDCLTVCDVEVMGLTGSGDGTQYGDIYLFDVLLYKGKRVAMDGLEKREPYLDLLARALGSKVHKKILIRLAVDEYDKQIRSVYNRKERTYKIDGLIFTQAGEPYRKMLTYKWKPAEELSIDFLIMAVPKHMIGIKPYTPPDGHSVFWLFSGIRHSDMQRSAIQKIKGWNEVFNDSDYPNMFKGGPHRMIPIQFSTPSHPYAYIYYHPNTGPESKIASADELSGHVGEFLWRSEASGFRLKNMRPDKDIEVANGNSYGNAYRIALDTFMVIENPVTIDDLTKRVRGAAGAGVGEEHAYFQSKKAEMYKPAVKFNNFVVAQLLRTCEDKNWVVDLAGGRGSHLFTYNGFGVRNGLFIDNDRDALEELVRRGDAFGDRKLYLYGNRPHKNMQIYTIVADLTKPAAKILNKIEDVPMPSHGADVVVCTFALHYLIESSTTNGLGNIIELVDALLKPGGVFIFTCLSGSRVRDLFASGQKEWSCREGGQLKYSIKRVAGSMDRISVIHPFSNGEYYEETLVDVDKVIGAFEKHSYVMHQNSSFGDWLPKFEQFNTRVYSEMSEEDNLYSSLYQYVSLWKPVKK